MVETRGVASFVHRMCIEDSQATLFGDEGAAFLPFLIRQNHGAPTFRSSPSLRFLSNSRSYMFLLSFFAPFFVSYSVAMICFQLRTIHAEHPFQLPTFTGCCLLFFCRPSWIIVSINRWAGIFIIVDFSSGFHRYFVPDVCTFRSQRGLYHFLPQCIIYQKNKHDCFIFGLPSYYTVVFSKTLHYNFIRLSKLILKRKMRSFGGLALKGSLSGPSSHISRSMNRTCPSLRTSKTVERRVP